MAETGRSLAAGGRREIGPVVRAEALAPRGGGVDEQREPLELQPGLDARRVLHVRRLAVLPLLAPGHLEPSQHLRHVCLRLAEPRTGADRAELLAHREHVVPGYRAAHERQRPELTGALVRQAPRVMAGRCRACPVPEHEGFGDPVAAQAVRAMDTPGVFPAGIQVRDRRGTVLVDPDAAEGEVGCRVDGQPGGLEYVVTSRPEPVHRKYSEVL